MAHNLELRDGEYSYVGVRTEPAWHKLGHESVNERMSVNEAIDACKADYDVRKDYLLKITKEELDSIQKGLPINKVFQKQDVIRSHQCTVREDLSNILGVVGSGYEVVQNRQGFEFVQDILNGCEGNIVKNTPYITTAGVLGNGERIFVTAKFPTPVKIKGTDDIVEDYVLFTNAHDGSGAIIATFTPTRVVCNNTLNFALAGAKNKIYFKHTKNVHGKLDLKNTQNLNMALSVLRGHEVYVETLTSQLAKLEDIKLNEKDIKRIVAGTFLSPDQLKELAQNDFNFNRVDKISPISMNRIESMMNTIESGVGQDKWRGTGLWVINGFTSFYQNNKKYKTNESKFDSIMNGDAFKKVQKAYELVSVY
jgi:phage/plasmid-like protein (TIGR03299 family)